MKRVILLGLAAMVFYSCEKRGDYFFGKSENPIIEVSGENNLWSVNSEFKTTIKDSLKLSEDYCISYSFSDFTSLKGIKIKKPTFGKVFYENVEIYYDVFFPVSDNGKLIYKANTEGVEALYLTAQNVYELISDAKIELEIFENIKPTVKLEIVSLNNLSQYEYLFDATGSFDGDAKFGGTIEYFVYKIDSLEEIYPSGDYKKIFNGSGDHSIQVYCVDNNGVLSEYINQTFTVN